MAMSTADSFLNISAVLLANDTYKRNIWHGGEKLYAARMYTFVIGALSLLLVFTKDDLLSLLLFQDNVQ